MVCRKCGTVINNNDILCPICGSETEIKLDNNISINKDAMPINIENNKKLDTKIVEKKNKTRKYLIILLIILLMISSVFIGYNYAKAYIAKTKRNVTYDVYYKNYIVSVLNSYIYDTSNIEKGFLTFSDDIDNYVLLININEGNYYKLNNDYLKLKPILENQGLIVKNINKKKMYEREYITVNIVNHGEEQILMYTKLDDNNIITLLLVNKNHTYDYTYVKNITPLLKNIKVNSTFEKISNNEFILVDISSLTN